LPATRLQPLPFPEPERFVAYIEEDPSLIEPGLRIVARRLPLPGAGDGVGVDLLAVDTQGRITAIDVRPQMTVHSVETAMAARSWIQGNLPTLKALCPSLEDAAAHTRSLLIGGRMDPSLESFVSLLAPPRPDLLEASLFDSPSGPAISLRPVGVAAPMPTVRRAHVPALAERLPDSPSAEVPADPLAGIPLTAEELAEFRQIMASRPGPAASSRSGGSATPRPGEGASFCSMVEN
jgi:hypothetical protein